MRIVQSLEWVGAHKHVYSPQRIRRELRFRGRAAPAGTLGVYAAHAPYILDVQESWWWETTLHETGL